MKVDGECLCGHVTYEAEIDMDKVAICHCRDCQLNSGTAFGVVAGVFDEKFVLLSGELKEFQKTVESGRIRKLSFCPCCGTRIHARTERDPTAFLGCVLAPSGREAPWFQRCRYGVIRPCHGLQTFRRYQNDRHKKIEQFIETSTQRRHFASWKCSCSWRIIALDDFFSRLPAGAITYPT